ncbi:MAG: hypothetical protein PHN82_01230 [bacterium]|nr:hypothetical protein [bacterium]
MGRRLHLTVEVDEREDGIFEAHCPELSLSAKGRFAEEAVDRLKEMVFASVGGNFDATVLSPPDTDQLKPILARHKHCYLYMPPGRRAH